MDDDVLISAEPPEMSDSDSHLGNETNVAKFFLLRNR